METEVGHLDVQRLEHRTLPTVDATLVGVL